MIQRDYFIRQLAQFIQALIAFLLKKDIPSFEIKNDYIKYGADLLGLDKKELLTYSGKQFIDMFSQDSYGLEKLEAIAYMLLLNNKDAMINSESVVKEILTYVEEHSSVYSIERNRILSEIGNYEKENES